MENLTRKERRKLIRLKQKQDQKLKNDFSKIRKVVAYVIGGILLLFAVYFFVIDRTISDSSVAGEKSVSDSVWIRGNQQAEIKLVVYSDFQCPACALYGKTLENIFQNYQEKVQIEFKHFPLNIHKNANKASLAAEAAGIQGKFWEMHDILFDKQSLWANEKNPDDNFVAFASEIGLDVEKFKNDYNDADILREVNVDLKEGRLLKINATPTFYLNNNKLEDVSPQMLQEEIEKLI